MKCCKPSAIPWLQNPTRLFLPSSPHLPAPGWMSSCSLHRRARHTAAFSRSHAAHSHSCSHQDEPSDIHICPTAAGDTGTYLGSVVAPAEAGGWRSPGRCFVAELSGRNKEAAGEEAWLEVPGLADAPLPSAFVDKNASGLDRKQEARADREVLGERARPAGG